MEIVLHIIHLLGIVSFAAAGAMVAIDRETDLFGVVFLAVITCFGGGLMRDVIVGDTLPVFFTMYVEIALAVATALVVFFIASRFKRQYVREEAKVNAINNVLDALGIGVFSAAGTDAYLYLGPLVAILMGMLSSVGGSLIRDIMLRDIPFILRKRIYALAVLIGSAVYYVFDVYILAGVDGSDVFSTIACVITVFTIRMCATCFKWNMPKAINFSEMHEGTETDFSVRK